MIRFKLKINLESRASYVDLDRLLMAFYPVVALLESDQVWMWPLPKLVYCPGLKISDALESLTKTALFLPFYFPIQLFGLTDVIQTEFLYSSTAAAFGGVILFPLLRWCSWLRRKRQLRDDSRYWRQFIIRNQRKVEVVRVGLCGDSDGGGKSRCFWWRSLAAMSMQLLLHCTIRRVY